MNFKKIDLRKISIVLYIIALFIPIFSGSDYNGVSGLFLGWIGLVVEFDLNIGLPWLANIFYFFNLIVKKISIGIKITISLLSITLGLFAIGIEEILVHEGGLMQSVEPGIGLFLWISSFVLLLIYQLIRLNKKTLGNNMESNLSGS